jgi:hypothetical protein
MKRPPKTPARPQRAQLDSQVLRELQKALAVTKCIRLTADYGEDDSLDLADALAGLLVLLEGVALLMDRLEAGQ